MMAEHNLAGIKGFRITRIRQYEDNPGKAIADIEPIGEGAPAPKNRPPYETFKGPTCKGCFALGSACGNCERCDWEADMVIRLLRKSLSQLSIEHLKRLVSVAIMEVESR